MKKLHLILFAIVVSMVFSTRVFSMEDEDLKRAASLFIERCSICHGNAGLGEGLIPLKVDDYPPTNLYKNIQYNSREEIAKVIAEGAPIDDPVRYMPPWKGELNKADISLLVDFVLFFRSDYTLVAEKLKETAATSRKGTPHGESLYATRCVLCHGTTGKGDGRMARIIKTPPPANLQASTVDKSYIKAIIQHGGEPLKRSPQMPPWGDQLTDGEIDAVVDYVYSLRK